MLTHTPQQNSVFPQPGSEAASQCGASGFDVVMLTTAHSATDDRIFGREAQTLAEAGLSVCILGLHPRSESSGGVRLEALPSPRNRLQRFLRGWEVLRRARRLGGRLYVFHDPELFGVGLILRLLGKRVVYDCHENVPMQVLQKFWIPTPLRFLLVPLVSVAEWLCSRFLTGVITVNETLEKRFPRGRTVLRAKIFAILTI